MKKSVKHFLQIISNLSKQNGFTLMEILVTVVIIGIIGAIATQSLFSLLRGASKVEIIKELKQSGDFAISAMSLDIRNAKDVTIVEAACNDSAAVIGCAAGGTPGECLRITNIDGTNSYYGCVNYADPINGNIYRLTKGGTNYLTNTGVKISSGCTTIFMCIDSNPGNTPRIVKINFTLQQAQTTANAAESATQIFDTQVALRNK